MIKVATRSDGKMQDISAIFYAFKTETFAAQSDVIRKLFPTFLKALGEAK